MKMKKIKKNSNALVLGIFVILFFIVVN